MTKMTRKIHLQKNATIPKERVTIPCHSQQNEHQTGGCSEDILTNPLPGLTKSLPELVNLPLGGKKENGKGK